MGDIIAAQGQLTIKYIAYREVKMPYKHYIMARNSVAPHVQTAYPEKLLVH